MRKVFITVIENCSECIYSRRIGTTQIRCIHEGNTHLYWRDNFEIPKTCPLMDADEIGDMAERIENQEKYFSEQLNSIILKIGNIEQELYALTTKHERK